MHTVAVRKLLACENPKAEHHLHRYLFDDNKVRYIKIMKGTDKHYFHTKPLVAVEAVDFQPTPMPPAPAGNWNWGTVDIDPQTNQPCFTKTRKEKLMGVDSEWHCDSFDHLKLRLYESEGEHHLQTFRPPQPNVLERPIFFKIALFPSQIDLMQNEIDTYKQIRGRSIGPEFLGHVTEEARTIGFVVEKLEEFRPPTSADYGKCEAVLKKLHGLRILHGDMHGGNILVNDHRAVLIDFEDSKELIYLGEARQELRDLRDQLAWNGSVILR